MNDDQIQDLKQFIDARLSQSEDSLESRFDKKIDELRSEMRDGFAGVADAIGFIHDKTDDQEQRITKLEAKAA